MPTHPTAVVSADADVDDSAIIGPYCVIEGPVQVGAGTVLGPHVFVCGHTRIGRDCRIHTGAAIGDLPQDRAFTGATSYCRIGDGVILREHVTVHRGTAPESVT